MPRHCDADPDYKKGDRMTITIKRSVLADPKLLNISVGHELQHAVHTWTGLMATWRDRYGFFTGTHISEYEAYLWEVAYHPDSVESWRRLSREAGIIPPDYSSLDYMKH